MWATTHSVSSGGSGDIDVGARAGRSFGARALMYGTCARDGQGAGAVQAVADLSSKAARGIQMHFKAARRQVRRVRLAGHDRRRHEGGEARVGAVEARAREARGRARRGSVREGCDYHRYQGQEGDFFYIIADGKVNVPSTSPRRLTRAPDAKHRDTIRGDTKVAELEVRASASTTRRHRQRAKGRRSPATARDEVLGPRACAASTHAAHQTGDLWREGAAQGRRAQRFNRRGSTEVRVRCAGRTCGGCLARSRDLLNPDKAAAVAPTDAPGSRSTADTEASYEIGAFEQVRTLGHGAFGRVKLIKHKTSATRARSSASPSRRS